MHIEIKTDYGYANITFHCENTVIDLSYEDIDSLGNMVKEIYSAISYKLGDRFYDWESGNQFIDGLLDLGIKELQHHKDTTVGLYATDKPECIPDSIKEKFFQI